MPETYGGWPVVTAQRNAIPLFGTGLFEFVSDATIVANADPDDADGDGISGRYNTDFGDIGRFGVKAQSHNVERFTRGPLQNQMGITTDPFEGTGGAGSGLRVQPQVSTDPDEPTIDHDGVDDPEIGRDDLGDLIAFTRFLAPPEPQPFDDAARRGEATFDAIGCVRCHVPALPSSRGHARRLHGPAPPRHGAGSRRRDQHGRSPDVRRPSRTRPRTSAGRSPSGASRCTGPGSTTAAPRRCATPS